MANEDGGRAAPDLVPVEVMRGLSGLEYLQRMRDGRLPQAPIGHVLKFVQIDVEAGRVTFAGTPEAAFYNPIGSVHGGWAATLLDSAMGCAVQSMLEAGFGYTTLEIKVNYVRPLTDRTGPVHAEGRAISVGRRVGTADGRLVDSSGRLLAHGTTTCLIFPI